MYHLDNKFILIIIIAIAKCSRANEYFSSITGLERLLNTEEILMNDLKEYLESSKQQIIALERELNRISYEHKLASVDVENYLTNPVNSYRLMKRLHTDWYTYEQRIRQDHIAINFLERVTESRAFLNFPNQEDVDGSALALIRLQETYKLNVTQIAAGVLNGVKYGTDMTWQDCFTLGQQLMKLEEYNHTKVWLKESMIRLAKEEYCGEPTSLDFMEGVAENLFQLGDLEAALYLCKQVILQNPERSKAWALKYTIELLDKNESRAPALTTKIDTYEYHNSEEYKIYEQICRGDLLPSEAQQRPLRCRYITSKKYHLLSPFKVEEHNLDPLILTFHDMITDSKINTIKDMAIPHMQRSTVRTQTAHSSKKSNFRISKNAWLPYETHEYMQDMLYALHDATGLDMTYCEELQVANYGLGGHYEPHWDFYVSEAQIPDGNGNRIATAIFYFSDVEQGGATVFPFLNIAVKPKKGNVLFWYNLHRSLDKDYRTKHAGCPVLKGSKWIANVWIRDLTQTFARPCALKRDNEISLKYQIIQ